MPISRSQIESSGSKQDVVSAVQGRTEFIADQLGPEDARSAICSGHRQRQLHGRCRIQAVLLCMLGSSCVAAS
jgi:hypothetical protein